MLELAFSISLIGSGENIKELEKAGKFTPSVILWTNAVVRERQPNEQSSPFFVTLDIPKTSNSARFSHQPLREREFEHGYRSASNRYELVSVERIANIRFGFQ